MDMWTHTLLAVSCLALAYYAGYFIQIKTITKEVDELAMYNFIKFLDEEGFVKTNIDEDGDLEIVPIKDLIEKQNRLKENASV